MATTPTTGPDVRHPESDGEPMQHRDATVDLILALEGRFAEYLPGRPGRAEAANPAMEAVLAEKDAQIERPRRELEALRGGQVPKPATRPGPERE